uniref:Putative Ubiquinone biosynthesis protein COQ7-like n=1 Tax=mine drainage metagenome TaxID=410659 RepID=E6PVJ8_9ZZZZ
MVTIHRAEPASSARSRASTRPGAVDRLLVAADNALKTLAGGLQPSRPMPAPPLARRAASQGAAMPLAERELSARLMRVNHVGEICAQALYQGQALAARDGQLRKHFLHASREEGDHLAWCAQRLRELDSRPSWLNPLWYAGAFGLGLLAGRVAGDKVSLGFVAETENQVEQHLASHLQRLPQADAESRAVVAQMQADEVEHARAADKLGAARLPAPVRWAMRGAAKVMTTTAQWV